MAPTSAEDNVKFLISCIQNFESGKVDFQKVADEMDIVTKGAAAKRYERLIKATKVKGDGDSNEGDDETSTATPKPASKTGSTKKGATKKAAAKSTKSAKSTPASKKRKMAHDGDENGNDELPTKSIFGGDEDNMEDEDTTSRSIFGGGED